MTKFDCFLQNTKMLNDKFNIVPLLYGSLGLEVLTNSSLNADDIDILIPQEFVTGDKWEEFKIFLGNHGYVLVDEHEHTFRKDGIDYSYADIEGLKEFAEIDICDIEIRNVSGVEFKLLTLEQYLRVYQKSSQDGYRMNVKEKQDNRKIEFIKKHMNTIIRKAILEDTPAIAELYREQFREMAKLQPYFIKEGDQSTEFIENIISGTDSDILVCEDNGEVIGFILLQAKTRPDFPFIVQGSYCYIMDVIVTENHRGNGFGTALMNVAKDWANEHECSFISLDVLSNNTSAIALYQKLGFTAKAQEMYFEL